MQFWQGFPHFQGTIAKQLREKCRQISVFQIIIKSTLGSVAE